MNVFIRQLRGPRDDLRSFVHSLERASRPVRRQGPLRPMLVLAAPLIVVAVLRGGAQLAHLFAPAVLAAAPTHLAVGGIEFGLAYAENVRARSFPLVFDQKGELLGILPPSVVGRTEGPYLSAPAREVPERWWQMVVALEDSHRGTFRHVAGIDWGGFAGIVLDLFDGRVVRGGSSLEMQLAKTINVDTDARGLSLLLRKLRDLLHAPLLAHLTGDDLPRWFATHTPMLHSNLHGLELAAHVLFHKGPAELDLAEQAVLAAAVRYRIPEKPSEKLWAQVRDRAELGLKRIRARDEITSDELEAALARLRALPAPSPRSGRSCERFSSSWKPDQRAIELGRDALVEAVRELQDRFGSDRWVDELASIQLGIDLDTHCRVRDVLANGHDRLVRTARARQSRGGACRVGPAGERMARDRSSLSLAVADETGTIVAYYTDRELDVPVYHGFNLRDGRPTWDYDPQRENRKIGSIGKLLVALLAAEEGDCAGRGCTPTRYFQQRRKKKRSPQDTAVFANYDGNIGSTQPSERYVVTPRQAFGGSDNLALMWRMRQGRWGRDRVEALIELFEFARPEAHFNPVIDIPMGNLYGSPRTIHRALQAVGMALAGRSGGRCRPGIVVAARSRDGDVIDPVVLDAGCQEVAALLDRPADRRFVRDALGATLELVSGFGKEVKGTAYAGMGRYAAERDPRIRWHIAKTGTTSSEERQGSSGMRPPTENATLAGAIETADGRLYSYVAQVRPKGEARSVGPCVYGSDVTELVAPILEMVLGREIGK